MHQFRSLGIALVVLGLSAGIVFAAHGMPGASSTGLSHASQMSGQQVPVQGANGVESERVAASASPSPTISVAATTAPESTNHPDNHGLVVSKAAHQSLAEANAALAPGQTPYPNHGAYVSSVARSGHGGGNHPSGNAAPSKSHAPDSNDSND